MSDVDSGDPVVAPEDDPNRDPDAENTEALSGGDVASLREQAEIAGDQGDSGAGTFPWTDPDRPENAEAMGGAGFRDVQMPASASFGGRPITSDESLAVDSSGPAPVLVPATTQEDVAAGRETGDPGEPEIVNEADLNASGRGIPEGAVVGRQGTLGVDEAGGTAEAEEDVEGEDDMAQYSTGGGWYELPDGRKVQGREAARAALDEC
jgi:hypothetical protein